MFRMKKLAAGLAALVAVVGLGFGLTGGTGPRADAQAPQPSQPADDLKTQRERLDKEIAAAKNRVRQLEAERAELQQHEELLNSYRALIIAQKKAALTEPYIGLWVRPQSDTSQALARYLMLDPKTAAQLQQQHFRIGGGWRSEFAINEIYGVGKPVVEVHFYDIGSLQTYLTRAAKDPTAPKKLQLDIDKEYPAAKVKPVLDACKAAGFATIELVSAPQDPAAPARAAAPAAADRAKFTRAYLNSVHLDHRLILTLPDMGVGVKNGLPVNPWNLHKDAYLFEEATGQRRDWKDLKQWQIVHLYFTPHDDDPYGLVAKVGIPAASAKTDLPPYLIEAPDVLRIEVAVHDGETTFQLPGQPVFGEFLVRPDGTVGLGTWGAVSVSGLTIDQATEAIRKHLLGNDRLKEKPLRPWTLAVVLDVHAYNSKVYYLVTDGTGEGEHVTRLPITGNETVLDAVAQVSGLSDRVAGSRVWIARRATKPGEPWQTLPVDWKAITEQGDTKTNYVLLPGDRLYVKPRAITGTTGGP
jgi:polysaccharide export outer membrane protein